MGLTPVQQAIIIDLVVHGADKAQNIANRVGFHRNTVSSQMTKLVDKGHLISKGGGVHRVSDGGLDLGQTLIRSGENPYVDDDSS